MPLIRAVSTICAASAESCTTETAPPDRRSRGTWKACSEHLPAQVERIFARADSGFYCGDAVVAYEARGVQFIISARKTGRLVEELKAATWTPSPRTDADGQCELTARGLSPRKIRSLVGRSPCLRFAGHFATSNAKLGAERIATPFS